MRSSYLFVVCSFVYCEIWAKFMRLLLLSSPFDGYQTIIRGKI